MGGQMAKGVAAFDPETGLYLAWFPSGSEAARQMYVNRVAVMMCANGRRKTAGGFKWLFMEKPNAKARL